jgi:hypothetical protein
LIVNEEGRECRELAYPVSTQTVGACTWQGVFKTAVRLNPGIGVSGESRELQRLPIVIQFGTASQYF